MTLDEIRQRYPNQWVLIEFSSLDDELRVTDGTVVAHSASREEIDNQLMTMRKERIAVEYTGDCDTEERYLL
jgi:hypothetical protein